jgi:hypothetical protein
MEKVKWPEHISAAYKLGSELGVLDGISLENFTNKVDTKKIEKKAKNARRVLPKTSAFYRKMGASDIFLERFTDYINNNELRSLGDELVYQAEENKAGFRLDWKETFKDCFREMKVLVPELSDDLIKDTVSTELITFIDNINTKAKEQLGGKEFVHVESIGDTDHILFVNSEVFNRSLDNPYVLFGFAGTYKNITGTKQDLADPHRRVKQLIKATDMLLDYEDHTRDEDLFLILVLLEQAIDMSRSLVLPDNEEIIKQKDEINQKLEEIRDKIHKISRKLYQKQREELLDQLGNSISSSWRE